jgi:hypothetical protein
MVMLKRGSMIDSMKKSSCAACVGPFHAVAQCESGVHFMSSRTIRFSAITFAMALGLAIALVGVSRASASSAAAVDTAPAITQCNPPDFPGDTAGFQVTCTVTVVNTTTSTGATSSTVTISACLAAAGVPFPSCPLNSGPITSTTSSTQLVTSVNQCNGIVTGGGSNVYCNVTVTNNVPVDTSTSAVTVNQCNNAATTTELCDPYPASTSGATVTQCNGSGGKGTYVGTYSVQCTVTGAASALPVTVNQCNGTATGGGSSVTCMTTMINNFVATTTTTTTTTTPATTTTTTTAPTTTTTTAPTTTTAAAGSGSSGTAGGSSSGTAATLAFTGAHLTATILAGLLAIILGVMMLLAARRRATDEDFRK